jgi:hypothetical protein
MEVARVGKREGGTCWAFLNGIAPLAHSLEVSQPDQSRVQLGFLNQHR